VVDSGGRLYSPMVNFSTMTWAGSLFNEQIFFEIPADLMSFSIQGGAMDGDRDGFQTVWEVDLTPGDISGYLPDESPVVEGPATFELVSETNVGSSSLRDGPPDLATMDVLSAEVLSKYDGSAPDLGFKWLLLEVQIVAPERVNFGEEAIHVEAEGEWYPHPFQINELLQPGQVWAGQLLFEVPVSASEALLKFGAPTSWPDGERAEYKLALP